MESILYIRLMTPEMFHRYTLVAENSVSVSTNHVTVTESMMLCYWPQCWMLLLHDLTAHARFQVMILPDYFRYRFSRVNNIGQYITTIQVNYSALHLSGSLNRLPALTGVTAEVIAAGWQVTLWSHMACDRSRISILNCYIRSTLFTYLIIMCLQRKKHELHVYMSRCELVKLYLSRSYVHPNK